MRRFVLFCNRSLFRGIVLALVAWNAAAADFLTGPSGGGKAEFSTASRAPLEYLPRVWETDEGLPYNRVQAIAQTLDGYLWVGTYQGLARFDGLQFTTFNNGSIPELNRASITALCTMADGTLWIGTARGALVRWRSGQFSVIQPQEARPDRDVNAIYQGSDGAIWIGSVNGLEQRRGSGGQRYTVKQGLLAEEVTAICEDNESNIWIGTSRGLNRLRAGKIEAFSSMIGFTNDPVRSLCRDRNGRVWIGSDHGLICYESGRFHAYNTSNGLSGNLVTSVFEDSQSNLWVGTYSGLNRFIDGRLCPELSAGGMPYDKINTISEDRWGDIWAGSREGLIRLAAKPFTVYSTRQGLSHNYIKSVLEDHLGRLWVGTWGGGLDQIIGNTVRVYATSNHFASDFILALCEDRNGGIWAGSDNRGGLSYINSQKVTHFTSENGLPDAAVSALYQDRAGELWVGTTAGLGRWKNDHFVRETECGNSRIWAICEDGEGDLWIGSDSGLIHRHGETCENLKTTGLLPMNQTVALLADADGRTLWIGTPTLGLFRLRNNTIDSYTMQQGLPTDEILGMVEDQGWLWMTSTRGIFRVRKIDLESPGVVMPCVTYGKADGLESIVCGGTATPSVWKTEDGRLCFATTKGLAVIDGRNTRLELSPPPVWVEQFDLDHKEMPLPAAGELVVPPNRGELEFRYTALDLRAPEKCRFKYKLDGIDHDWIDAGTRRVALYNNIAPGAYTFHVTACTKDGVWNREGASILLQLRPHLWQTWWFQFLCAGAVLGGVAGIVRTVTHGRMQRQLELQEQRHAVERERARIAKDIHDDLGSSLTRIMLLGRTTRQDLAEHKEIEPHLRKIEASCDATIQTMDEIVWAVNPENDNLDGLVDYLSDYAGGFFEDTSIRCQFELPVTPLSFILPAEIRHDLFLAVKEALNNVIKHSGASQAFVQVSVQGETVQIVIADNGRGFDASQPASGRNGHGLDNIAHRLEKHGGRVEFTSGAGQGTRLTLSLQIKQRKTSSSGTVYS